MAVKRPVFLTTAFNHTPWWPTDRRGSALVEITFKELKVELRGGRHDLLRAHTPEQVRELVARTIERIAAAVNVLLLTGVNSWPCE